MLEGLPGELSLGRVEGDKLAEKVDGHGVDSLGTLLNLLTPSMDYSSEIFGHGRVEGKVSWEVLYFGPVFWCRRPCHIKDVAELLDIRTCSEEASIVGKELGEDTACRPGVHTCSIVVEVSKEDFRGPEVTRDHVFGVSPGDRVIHEL